MNYLENAMDLDVHLVSEYPVCLKISDQLFCEIKEIIAVRNPARSKETLKLVLINLWISYMLREAIKYSRNRNHYRSHKRYGLVHFKYNRLIPIVDALEELGYLTQWIGFQDRAKKFARQTRIAPTGKLIGLFLDIPVGEPRVIKKTQPFEIVQLKNEDKDLINYTDTRAIQDMRANLTRYNEFIGDQSIEVKLPMDVEVNTRFLNKLSRNILKGVVDITELEFIEGPGRDDKSSLIGITDEELLQYLLAAPRRNNTDLMSMADGVILTSLPSNTPDYQTNETDIDVTDIHNTDIMNRFNLEFINTTYTMTKMISLCNSKKLRKSKWLQKRYIADFGINRLCFRLWYSYLHRVFSNDSFKFGGRFYGAFHLELPKEVRPFIFINGEPTVELDFSALHIRMLYHLMGEEYTTDPYQDVCETEEERGIYKSVLLVAINAETQEKAVKGIRDELRKKNLGIGLTDAEILYRLNRFKEVHPHIAHYLNTGIGLRLQNLDSRITDIVLKRMTQSGIPCLPVHDSYIVPVSQVDVLYQEMTQAYQAVMKGFSPVIK